MPDKTAAALSKIAVCAFLTVLAAVTGVLEGLLSFLLPLPGAKLGLANIFLTAAFALYGAKYAFFVFLSRALLVFLFGGNPLSLALSLAGGLLAYLSLFLTTPHVGKRLSYIGVSSFSAACHAVGQVACAYFFIGEAVVGYLPLLGAVSVVTGTLTGFLMDLVIAPLRGYLQKRRLLS